MARIPVAHHPELTTRQIRDVLQRHLGDSYHIQEKKQSVVVQKNGWMAVAVSIVRVKGDTFINTRRYVPKPWLAILPIGIVVTFNGSDQPVVGLLLTLLLATVALVAWFVFLGPGLMAVQREIASAIESADELQ